MMGTKERNFLSLEDLSLEELVSEDNFYRRLERTVDLSFVRELVRPCYASGGRPSVDPVVFFRLQLVMFFEDIRSERQLMVVAAHRLSIRWYLGYDLHESLPDHSSLTKIRERYGLELFRRFFEEIVELCIEAGLVRGEELFFDSTKVKANADIDSLASRFLVETHLSGLFEEPWTPEGSGTEPSAGTTDLDALPTVEDEALIAANGAKNDWISRVGKQDRSFSSGSRKRTSDLRVSRTDPDATSMLLGDGETKLGYQTHYMVDGDKARVILNVLVTPSEVTENRPMLDLLWRTTFRWRLWPHHVTGDAKYGSAENVAAVEKAGIRAYIVLPKHDKRGPLFGKNEFVYATEKDLYICPEGETLRRQGLDYKERSIRYAARPSACNACPLKTRCTKSKKKGRWIRRSFDEEYLERVRGYQDTEPYRKALRKRQVWVDPLFGEAKDWHGSRRFRLRRLEKVNIEALLIAAGQNVKRLLTFGERVPRRPGQVAVLRRPAPNLDKFCGVCRHRNRRFRCTARVFQQPDLF